MKHLFFDLDHTLWDFEKNSRKALEQIFYEYELNTLIKSFEKFHSTYKTYNSKLWRQYGAGKITKDVLRSKRFRDTLSNFNIHNSELAVDLGEAYINISPYQTELFPNTKEVLQNLKSAGHELHIITNGFKEIQHSKLEKSGILDFFQVVLCSEEVGVNKPNPKVFHHALNAANAKTNNSVMIGDDHKVDVMGAEAIGIQGVLFDPKQKYKDGTHNWHINNLIEIHDILPWIKPPLT